MRPIPGAEARRYGAPLVFDPADGETVLAPPGEGEGHWVGAPSALYDAHTSRFYLYYREREPRPVRGGRCFIAESDDGVSFRAIWGARKEELDSPSVERCCLAKGLDNQWLLYLSYVDPRDGRWRIDVAEADAAGGFDLFARRKVFTASDVAVEGVKDPWVMIVNGLYYMLISYAVALDVPEEDQARMHASADIYNTGLTLSSTALAASGDGRQYEWTGGVLAPRADAWDAYCARLGCLVPTASGWIGYYDGAS